MKQLAMPLCTGTQTATSVFRQTLLHLLRLRRCTSSHPQAQCLAKCQSRRDML